MEEREEVAWDIPLEDEELEYEEEEYEEYVEPEDWEEGEVLDIDESPNDLIIIRKETFIKLFGSLLYEEQAAELLGGYYDGDTMTVWLPDGPVTVTVDAENVAVRSLDYDRLKAHAERRRSGVGG